MNQPPILLSIVQPLDSTFPFVQGLGEDGGSLQSVPFTVSSTMHLGDGRVDCFNCSMASKMASTSWPSTLSVSKPNALNFSTKSRGLQISAVLPSNCFLLSSTKTIK